MRIGNVTKPISTGRAGSGRGCGIVFGGIFMLAGAGIFAGLTIWPVLRWTSAQRWVATPCVITHSDVKEHTDSEGDSTYGVDIRYEYEFRGRRYEGDRYNFVTGSSSGYDGKRAIVDRYPEDSERSCYVNPNDPAEAILNRQWSWGYAIGCLGLIFLTAGLVVAFSASRTSPAISAGKRRAPIRAIETPGGALVLKPGMDAVARLVVVIFIAAFWNGIVSFFLWSAFSGAWPLFIFLLPFVAVGLLLIAGVVYSILALFNPRVQLTLNPGCVPLAGTATLDWHMTGAASRVAHFEIVLVGKEKATYRQGTDTRTDTSTFFKQPVVTTENIVEMRAGRTQLSIPEFTMHTFDADNNHVKWYLRVHGDIRRWPDVNEEYEFMVLPLKPPNAT